MEKQKPNMNIDGFIFYACACTFRTREKQYFSHASKHRQDTLLHSNTHTTHTCINTKSLGKLTGITEHELCRDILNIYSNSCNDALQQQKNENLQQNAAKK